MTTRKSQIHLPHPTTGEQELHHFETELAQIADMTSFAQNLNKKADAATMRSHIGAAADTNATTSAAGLMSAADKVKADNIVHSAAAHNGIYRGKDLTSYAESGKMSAAIADGSFKDIYIGDFITKTINLPAITYTDKAGASKTQAAQTFANVKWLVAALDPHLHCGYYEGDTVNYGETKEHHVLLIPASTLQRNVCMNPKVSNADTTAGGYIGSDMWRVHMPNWAAAIKSAFGASHVLRHYSIMSNSVDVNAPSAAGVNWKGSANSWVWTPVDVNIPNEAMVYGGSPASSSFEDTGDFPRILPLYALKCNHLEDRSWFWLRSVSSSADFADARGDGVATADVASCADAGGGIRPYFLYH